MKHSLSIFRNISLLFLSASLVLASCSKDKDDSVSSQQSAFVGKYLVVDASETYTVEVLHKGGNNFQIKEFAGFLNVPLNACIEWQCTQHSFANIHQSQWEIHHDSAAPEFFRPRQKKMIRSNLIIK
jgi:hypothetical protein